MLDLLGGVCGLSDVVGGFCLVGFFGGEGRCVFVWVFRLLGVFFTKFMYNVSPLCEMFLGSAVGGKSYQVLQAVFQSFNYRSKLHVYRCWPFQFFLVTLRADFFFFFFQLEISIATGIT